MTKKRLLLIAGTMASIACTILVILAMLPPRPSVTFANYDRIKDGMTTLEVEDRLGPPMDLSPNGTNWGEFHNGKLTIGHAKLVWGGDDGAAVIVFDEQDRIVHKTWIDNPRPFFQRLRDWLHLH
jgi:hypothetical protein